MSLEEIQKLKERLGLKLFDAVVSEKSVSKKKKKPVFKRENKNRPREMSSKKMVPRFRDVVGVASEQNTKDRAKDKRDPRFDSLCGEFSKKVRAEIGSLISVIVPGVNSSRISEATMTSSTRSKLRKGSSFRRNLRKRRTPRGGRK